MSPSADERAVFSSQIDLDQIGEWELVNADPDLLLCVADRAGPDAGAWSCMEKAERDDVEEAEARRSEVLLPEGVSP